MTGEGSDGPVAEFCAGLRRLQEDCGLDRAALARQVSCGSAQLSELLDGEISQPPDWDRVVEPLIRACTNDDEREVAYWGWRHDVLVQTYDGAAGPARATPAQLPADVDAFTGRARELAELDDLLTADRTAAAGSTAVVISAVSGTAGVGKTALALRWSHRVRAGFPDGQLYVNLRGYDPDQPMSVGDALAGFLRALGLAGQNIPLETDERAAAYRSLLDGRRMLVVLDNAATVDQIRPLLPGTPSALVVVTSRDALAGLVAWHGAQRLDLDLLPFPDAVALLRALIGLRVDAEPDAAVTLAGQCARLPLALRVAAELAASRPGTSLVEIVGELTDEQRRLDLLDAGGDPRTAVRPVFSWSYRHLSAESARAFRLLGLHPGPDLDPYAAAALFDTSRDQAQHLLDLLGRAHLIAPTGPGRYGMHDLLRAYATHFATTDDSAEERRAALNRLFDHYLATAAIAMDALVPAEKHRRPHVSAAVTPTPPLADPTEARAWLDVERATLVVVTAHTATYGWRNQTTRLATVLFRYLEAGGHYPDAIAVHTHALRAARDAGDLAAEAHALTNLGTVYWQQGSYQKAIQRFHQALTLAREIGDRLGEGRALGNLGNVHRQQGRYQQATDHQQQAVALFREIGDRAGELIALANLGVVCWRQGRYQQAEERLEEALTLSCEIGNRTIEAHALGNLGVVHWRQGRHQQAEERLEEALTLFREIGDRAGEAEALDHLGNVHRQQGRYQQATDHQQQALALSREIGDRAGEAEALNDVAATFRAVRELHEARIQHNAALTLAIQIGDRYEQARAHDGLAHTHQATGDPDQACHHWQQALTLYTDLGVPEVDDVRAHLAALDHDDGLG